MLALNASEQVAARAARSRSCRAMSMSPRRAAAAAMFVHASRNAGIARQFDGVDPHHRPTDDVPRRTGRTIRTERRGF